MKTDNASDATLLFPHTQEEIPEDITTKDTLILDETEVSISTRDTATNTLPNEQDLNDKVEKRLVILKIR